MLRRDPLEQAAEELSRVRKRRLICPHCDGEEADALSGTADHNASATAGRIILVASIRTLRISPSDLPWK